MKEVLSRLGDVEKFSYRQVLTSPFKKKDLCVINWIDNQFLNEKGRVSIVGTLKVYLKIALLKIHCKKIAYVRHNVYPHSTHKDSIFTLTQMTNRLSRFFDITFVHSPKFLQSVEKYIPHPLYQYPLTVDEHSTVQRDDDLYIIFGRIVRYKKIDEVIKLFPKNKRLLIAGFCEDKEYRDELTRLISGNSNVQLISKFLTDDEARKLVRSANAMIISHADDDMIVSGSFFYALSQRISIICVETPFMHWAEETLSNKVVLTCPSISKMCNVLSQNHSAYIYNDITISKINDLFSDDRIEYELTKLLS
ncbi:TPA: hypothetical protein MB325_001027 [Klebsiella quasipneumoniae subsp. quasipneumoniae]|nr:hypothetical protein [Klebsiella quasipneumoniae subsp. quasipneumoniae]